jgi:hypothetical protein
MISRKPCSSAWRIWRLGANAPLTLALTSLAEPRPRLAGSRPWHDSCGMGLNLRSALI